MNTVHQFIDYYARLMPNKTAIIDAAKNKSISYLCLHRRVNELASHLNSIVYPKDLVVVLSGHRYCLVEYILACSRIGVRCLPVVEPTAIEGSLKAARNQQSPVIIYSNDKHKKFSKPNDIWVSIKSIKSIEKTEVNYVPDSSSTFYVNSTSGTTGVPKLVSATHKQIICNTQFVINEFGFTQDDIHLSTYQFHAHDWFLRGLCSGGTSVLIESGVDYENIMDEIQQFLPTALMIGPHILSYFLIQRRVWPKSLTMVEAGGSKIDEHVVRQYQEKYGIGITAVWGSTETTGVALYADPNFSPEGSVGKPIGDYEVTIISAPSNSFRNEDEIGEMVISSDAVADSYIDKDNTPSGLNNGVFHTGDLVKKDKNGFIHIVGRVKNQFQRFGYVFNSESIEELLDGQKEISASMIVPIASFGGFQPIALIELANPKFNQQKPFKKLKYKIENKLNFALLGFPEQWLIVESVPRTPSGKLNRLAGYHIVQENNYLYKYEFSSSWKSYFYFIISYTSQIHRFTKSFIQTCISINIFQTIKQKFS